MKILRKAAALLSAALLLGTGFSVSAEALDLDAALASEDWNNIVEACMEKDQAPGLALAAVSGGEVRYKNWGMSDLAAQTQVTEDTVFQIGSCSKAFTALSVLLLQEEGKLSIEDSIGDYLPWWHVTYQGQDADVKIWQVLNHCAGIPNGETMAKYPFGTDSSLTEKTARIAENLELAREPGKQFEYCNLDYCILAYLTQTVSEMPFSDYVEQNILQPIGMTHSGYDLPTAQGYIQFFGKTKAYTPEPMKGSEGDGFLITTPKDMARWMQAQLGDLDLPENLANAIEASQTVLPEHQPEIDEGDNYFNGWIILENGLLIHTGMNPTFTSMVIIDREKDTAVFSVSNSVTNASEAAYPFYMTLIGDKKTAEYPVSANMMTLLDRVSMIAGYIFGGLLIIALISLLTQGRRLIKKGSTVRRERIRLIVRLIFLLPLLGLAIALPYLLGMLLGYQGFGYTMIWYWGAHSFIVTTGVLIALFLLLILISIKRFFWCKRDAKLRTEAMHAE